MGKIVALTTCSLGLLFGSAIMDPPAFASTHLNSYSVSYDAQIIMHPQGFVQNGTTYMSVQDIIGILKTMNINSAWSKGNLIIGDPIPVDLPDVLPLNGHFRIYVDGRVFGTAPLVQDKDQSSTESTTYIPIWYVMQALDNIGQRNSWNGHLWTLGHLFA